MLGLQEQSGGRGPAAAIDSDVLFRAGETLGGQPTYTPRLVLCDMSGALGGASAGGALYRDRQQPGSVASSAAVCTWADGQEVHRAAPVPRSQFAQELEDETDEPADEETEGGEAPSGDSSLAAAAAQLDSGGSGGVRYWTDYLKAHVHPRSVHQLAGAWHGLAAFSGWGDGGEHWRSEEQREEVMERVRWVVRPCSWSPPWLDEWSACLCTARMASRKTGGCAGCRSLPAWHIAGADVTVQCPVLDSATNQAGQGTTCCKYAACMLQLCWLRRQLVSAPALLCCAPAVAT